MTIVLLSPLFPTVQSDYVTQVQRLLHDANAQFWSVSELEDYINEARIRTVKDTGAYRQVQTVFFSTGVEVYPFGGVTGFNITNAGTGYATAPTVTVSAPGVTGGVRATAVATVSGGKITTISVTNPGTLYQSQPTVSFSGGGGSGAAATAYFINSATIDALNVSVFWGNTRRVLARWTWSVFNAKARAWIQYTGLPSVFSVYNYVSLYIAKIPDQAYQAEIDSVLEPPPLFDDTTLEVIPLNFQDPVQYWAAHLAKIKQQRWDEADKFASMYVSECQKCLSSAMTRALPYPYAT
jgi:hypothetical protein